MKKVAQKLIAWVLRGIYLLVAVFTTLFVGCSHMMPTRVPPLTEEFGYNVPNIKGYTTVGINEAVYGVELAKLETWRLMLDIVNKPMIEAHATMIDWMSVALAGTTFAGIPMALRKVPKGYIKEDKSSADES
jgi:hypothetical protein